MKQSEYIPISQRENIDDQDIAKIADYLERHANYFKHITYWYEADYWYIFDANDCRIFFNEDWVFIEKQKKGNIVFRSSINILANNISWIYQSLKNIQ